MEQSPDPVAQPDAYRVTLFAALGDDDPAVALASSPAALRQLISDAGDLLRVRPEPTEWSVLECVGAHRGRGAGHLDPGALDHQRGPAGHRWL